MGIRIIPTDNKSENYSHFYCSVEQLSDLDAIQKYDCPILFLCWSRTNPTGKFKGNKIIYIGEDGDGCTNGLPNDQDWKLIEKIPMLNWGTQDDFLGLFVRKT